MTFRNFVGIILSYINVIVVIMVAVLVLLFIFNVVKGITKSNSSEGREKLRDALIYGLIATFFAISFFAIARLIASSLGLT
jgi:hypothetical protein